MIDYLNENKDLIEKLPEFDNHEAVKYFDDPVSGLRGFIAIHRKNQSTPSFGATRLWSYSNDIDALKDALELSKMMSYKSALAGLKYGGAKGVIIAPRGNYDKNNIMSAYADVVNEMNGQFITGTDVGLTLADIKSIKDKCDYLVGFNGDPTEFTVFGLYFSIKLSVKRILKKESLSGISIAIQGVGKIGGELLRLIYEDADKIFISDTDKSLTDSMKNKFPKVEVVSPDEIHKQAVDIFSPCALGHSLNNKSVSELRCKIVAGGANNQLASEDIGETLHKNGILYAPDYVVNLGGLISVVDEYENSEYDEQRILKKIEKIGENLDKIFEISANNDKPTNIVANEMVKKIVG